MLLMLILVKIREEILINIKIKLKISWILGKDTIIGSTLESSHKSQSVFQ